MSTIETKEIVKGEEESLMKREYEDSIFTQRKPRMDEFEDTVYPHDEIIDDLEKLKSVEDDYEDAINAKAARHLELIIGKNSDKTTEQWLGKDASTYETADFDDELNGTDMVVEFHDRELGLIRLGIDVTTARRNGKGGKEKEKIAKEHAQSNTLFHIKYFKGTDEKGDTFLGGIDLPHVIVHNATNHVEAFWNKLERIKKEMSELQEKIDSKDFLFGENEERIQLIINEKKKLLKKYEKDGGIGFSESIFTQIITELKKLLKTAREEDYRDTIEKTLACVEKAYAEKKKEVREVEDTLNPPKIKKSPRSRKKVGG